MQFSFLSSKNINCDSQTAKALHINLRLKFRESLALSIIYSKRIHNTFSVKTITISCYGNIGPVWWLWAVRRRMSPTRRLSGLYDEWLWPSTFVWARRLIRSCWTHDTLTLHAVLIKYNSHLTTLVVIADEMWLELITPLYYSISNYIHKRWCVKTCCGQRHVKQPLYE